MYYIRFYGGFHFWDVKKFFGSEISRVDVWTIPKNWMGKNLLSIPPHSKISKSHPIPSMVFLSGGGGIILTGRGALFAKVGGRGQRCFFWFSLQQTPPQRTSTFHYLIRMPPGFWATPPPYRKLTVIGCPSR